MAPSRLIDRYREREAKKGLERYVEHVLLNNGGTSEKVNAVVLALEQMVAVLINVNVQSVAGSADSVSQLEAAVVNPSVNNINVLGEVQELKEMLKISLQSQQHRQSGVEGFKSDVEAAMHAKFTEFSNQMKADIERATEANCHLAESVDTLRTSIESIVAKVDSVASRMMGTEGSDDDATRRASTVSDMERSRLEAKILDLESQIERMKMATMKMCPKCREESVELSGRSKGTVSSEDVVSAEEASEQSEQLEHSEESTIEDEEDPESTDESSGESANGSTSVTEDQSDLESNEEDATHETTTANTIPAAPEPAVPEAQMTAELAMERSLRVDLEAENNALKIANQDLQRQLTDSQKAATTRPCVQSTVAEVSPQYQYNQIDSPESAIASPPNESLSDAFRRYVAPMQRPRPYKELEQAFHDVVDNWDNEHNGRGLATSESTGTQENSDA